MWVLIKRIKNAVVEERLNALLIEAYSIESKKVKVWLPKKAVNPRSIKGYFIIKENIALEKKLKHESVILKPKPLNPNNAKVCNEFKE
jgi:hypothetical protein